MEKKKARWIWSDHQMTVQQSMVYFRKKFSITEPACSLTLSICADSRYWLLVNGKRVLTGPCRAPRDVWYQDRVDVAPYLQTGCNELRVCVVTYPDHEEENNAMLAGPTSITTRGKGGLWISETETDFGLSTDDSYECRPAAGYSFPENQRAGYLGTTEYVDGRLLAAQEDGPYWKKAVILSEGPVRGIGSLWHCWTMLERPIPYPFEKEKEFLRCMRSEKLWETRTVPAGQTLSLEVDAGELVNAYPVIRMRCGSGSTLRITYAEGYGVQHPDGTVSRGVRDDTDGQELFGYSDFYIARDGVQTYSPFLFRAFRFLKLELTASAEAPLVLEQLSYRETGYPLCVTGRFESDDSELNRIWSVSLRTLERCMYETYMDCPHYEQMQYTMDTFLQIRYTLAVSADSRLAEKAIDDFAASQLYNGLMTCNSPARIRQMITGFPLYWVLMLETHMTYVGDRTFLRRHLGTLDKLLYYYEAHLREDGLLDDLGYWQFFDWVREWHYGSPAADGEINVLYNMLYVYALHAAASVCRFCGRTDTARDYERLAGTVSAAVRKYAYDAESGLFCDVPGKKPASQHAQIFAVLADVLPEAEQRALIERMIAQKEELAVPSYCFSYFLCRALEKTGLYAETDRTFHLWDVFRGLLKLNLTTWPEDFVTMRSDCHGWSALALYEFAACGLGVRPLEPGFAKIGVRPLECGLDSYHGTVPAGRFGTVDVSVAAMPDGTKKISVKAPDGAACIIEEE